MSAPCHLPLVASIHLAHTSVNNPFMNSPQITQFDYAPVSFLPKPWLTQTLGLRMSQKGDIWFESWRMSIILSNKKGSINSHKQVEYFPPTALQLWWLSSMGHHLHCVLHRRHLELGNSIIIAGLNFSPYPKVHAKYYFPNFMQFSFGFYFKQSIP